MWQRLDGVDAEDLLSDVSAAVSAVPAGGSRLQIFIINYSDAATAIRSPPQQIHKANSFAGCRSTAQQFSTEQIEQDRESDTDTTLKHPVNFQEKNTCVDARSYFT